MTHLCSDRVPRTVRAPKKITPRRRVSVKRCSSPPSNVLRTHRVARVVARAARADQPIGLEVDPLVPRPKAAQMLHRASSEPSFVHRVQPAKRTCAKSIRRFAPRAISTRRQSKAALPYRGLPKKVHRDIECPPRTPRFTQRFPYAPKALPAMLDLRLVRCAAPLRAPPRTIHPLQQNRASASQNNAAAR